MRILLVSCDLDVASLVWRGLGGPDNEVVHVRTGSEAVGKARLGCDVVLLDPRLPDMSGPDVVRRLRAESPTLQIMIVSDTANVAMATRGFGIGADGHIALPDEADALVETVYRVAGLPNPEDVTVVTDLWTLVIEGGRVTVDGERAWLARVEVRLLSLLARHPGRVFSRDELQRYLHPELDEPLPRVVDVTITRMRRILQMRTGGRNLIESVWGRGIKLGDPRAETGAE